MTHLNKWIYNYILNTCEYKILYYRYVNPDMIQFNRWYKRLEFWSRFQCRTD